jgi:hypothetical protein
MERVSPGASRQDVDMAFYGHVGNAEGLADFNGVTDPAMIVREHTP